MLHPRSTAAVGPRPAEFDEKAGMWVYGVTGLNVGQANARSRLTVWGPTTLNGATTAEGPTQVNAALNVGTPTANQPLTVFGKVAGKPVPRAAAQGACTSCKPQCPRGRCPPCSLRHVRVLECVSSHHDGWPAVAQDALRCQPRGFPAATEQETGAS